MTYNQLVEKILAILPDALFDERDGEIIISTGLRQTEVDGDEPLQTISDE